jgi:glycosyltransferase involved in cell wall biosynthesis
VTETLPKAQTHLRILMIAACPFPWPRGTPIRIQRLAQALVEQGHTVDVIAYHLGKTGEDLPFKVFRIAKVSYYDRVSAGPSISKLLVLNPMLVRSLLKVGKAGDYDIIHGHHIEGVIVARAARAMGLKLPIIYDAHTLVGSELLDYGPAIGAGIKRFIGSFFDHYFTRRADSVIAVTDSIKEEFVKRDSQPADRIYVIPNGIEEDFIQRAEKARLEYSACVEEGNTPAGKLAPTFMYAGNTAAYQGIDLMLKAFALVAQQIPNAQLIILTHESFADYQPLADSLGITDKLSISDGILEDLPAMLVQADVLLNPRTRCAGIPQKLLNYMAAGRPVVSFAGSAKIVIDRVDGLVVENGNIHAFSEAMLELVFNSELGKTLAAAGLKSMQTQYSWSSAAKKTLAVYYDTLTRHAEK